MAFAHKQLLPRLIHNFSPTAQKKSNSKSSIQTLRCVYRHQPPPTWLGQFSHASLSTQIEVIEQCEKRNSNSSKSSILPCTTYPLSHILFPFLRQNFFVLQIPLFLLPSSSDPLIRKQTNWTEILRRLWGKQQSYVKKIPSRHFMWRGEVANEWNGRNQQGGRVCSEGMKISLLRCMKIEN